MPFSEYEQQAALGALSAQQKGQLSFLTLIIAQIFNYGAYFESLGLITCMVNILSDSGLHSHCRIQAPPIDGSGNYSKPCGGRVKPNIN